jgi:dihydroorotate dehydrogenase (fumarate)
MQDAGASGIELNVYYIPTETFKSGAEVEQQYVDVLSAVKANVSIPVAIKVGPYFSSFADMACRLEEAGADALVLFNRFYQPDFDIETVPRCVEQLLPGFIVRVRPDHRTSGGRSPL